MHCCCSYYLSRNWTTGQYITLMTEIHLFKNVTFIMLRVMDTLQCDEFVASGQELCNGGFSFNKKYRWLSKKEIGCLIFFKEIVLIKGIRKLEEEIASTKRKNFLNGIKRNTIPLGNIVPFWGKTNCMREDRNDQVNRLTSLQYKLDLFSGAMEWCWWFLCVSWQHLYTFYAYAITRSKVEQNATKVKCNLSAKLRTELMACCSPLCEWLEQYVSK